MKFLRLLKSVSLTTLFASASLCLSAATSEIRVELKLDASDFIVGERVRGVVDVANSSPDKVSVGYSNSRDSLFVEVFRSSDMKELHRISKRPFVARFRVDSGWNSASERSAPGSSTAARSKISVSFMLPIPSFVCFMSMRRRDRACRADKKPPRRLGAEVSEKRVLRKNAVTLS